MQNAAANKAILADMYRLWHDSRGNALEEIFEIFADEIRFGSLAQGAAPVDFTAQAIGKAQVRDYFAALLSGWSMNYYVVDYMVAEGDRVVMVGSTGWTNKTTGKSIDTPKVDVWRFEAARAVEYYEYYDTAKLFAAATA